MNKKRSFSFTKLCLAFGLYSVFDIAAIFANDLNQLSYDGDFVDDELIVKFKDDSLKVRSAILESVQAKIKSTFRASGASVIKLSSRQSKQSMRSIVKDLYATQRFEYIELNSIVKPFEIIPNDPEFQVQYGLLNMGAGGGVIGADISATKAWLEGTGSKKILVGIIDTGVDYNHPDIAPNYWTNPGESGLDAEGRDKRSNGIDDDGNGYVDDFRGWDFANNDNDPFDDGGHGTHCAGVVGAKGNDGVGISGVNWDINLVGLKFISGNVSGTIENAIRAVEYATSLGVNFTSNSWGGGAYNVSMLAALQEANAKNIAFIAAAGNNSSNNDYRPVYPANYKVDNVISVGASNHQDKKGPFSNYGLSTVHVVAPGVDILSTIPNNKYGKKSGTSMATPHVSGVVALMLNKFPDLTPLQIKKRLIFSSDKVSSLATYSQSKGRVNAKRSLEVDSIPPSHVTNFKVASVSTTGISLQWSESGDDGDDGQSSSYQVRHSDYPIITDEDFENASILDGDFDCIGGLCEFKYDFQRFNVAGFVVVKSFDNVGNASLFSSLMSFRTKSIKTLLSKSAYDTDGIDIDHPWGVEDLASGDKVFSDSPHSVYQDQIEPSLYVYDVDVVSEDLNLMLDLKYDLEEGYDYLNVEASIDDGLNWVRLDSFTGNSGSEFKSVKISLQHLKLPLRSKLSVRFQLASDVAYGMDGVYIRKLDLVGPSD
ncbi:MAG: S8 family serine peptidase [Proteobacteria bacterium]|nr:S8 family serine peptidase [Pseudomonadota bacterium]